MTTYYTELPGWRGAIERFLGHHLSQHLLVFLIIINALILGLETDPRIHEAVGEYLIAIDHVILVIFIVELALLMASRGWRFFKDAWCVFDLIVIGIALVPATGSLSVLRALRVLRVL